MSKRGGVELEAQAQRTVERLKSIQSHFGERSAAGRMQGKVCILTGVGSLKGIGRATAILFAREGAVPTLDSGVEPRQDISELRLVDSAGAKHLYLIDYDGTNLPNLKQAIASQYPSTGATTLRGDAADDVFIAGVCQQAVREQGHLDVFFANAAIATAAPIAATDAEDVTNTLRVNTLSCFLAVKHASAAMLKSTRPGNAGASDRGSIVLTASVAGLRSGAGSTDYSASKAAVVSIAHTAANGFAGTGIRVNAVCPETGMTEPVFEASRARGTLGKMGQLNPLKRYGVAEEIAYAVLFLAGDESSYVNGVALPVDGGLSSSHPVIPGKLA